MAIIPCRECAHQVSDQAASCPSCGAPISSAVKDKPRARRPISKVLITLMTFWTLGTVLWLILPSRAPDDWVARAKLALQSFDHGSTLPASGPSNAAARPQRLQSNAAVVQTARTGGGTESSIQPPLALRPIYRTTAEQLYQAYEANAVAVQTSIGASLVRITGSVAGIDQDASGQPVVKLWTGKGTTAAMTLDENQRTAAAQLVKGESVAIECNRIGGAVLQGSDCSLAFVDLRTREVNLALFFADDSGTARVYVVGPMPETVCQERSDEISSRLRGKLRSERVVWRNCTEARRESILPEGCHLNSPSVTLPDVPTAHLWRYDCSSSTEARTASHRRTPAGSRRTAAAVATTVMPEPVEPSAGTAPEPESNRDATAAQPIPLPVADAQAVATTAPSPPTAPVNLPAPVGGPAPVPATASTSVAGPAGAAPLPTQHAAASNIRLASSAGRSDIGTAPEAGPIPAAEVTVAHAPQGSNNNTTTAPDDLAQIRVVDPQAANHIAAYCAKTPASPNRDAYVADCRRNEIGAWTRLVLQNEFPTLNEATRAKCSEPPFPDTYVAKESCARYELHVN